MDNLFEFLVGEGMDEDEAYAFSEDFIEHLDEAYDRDSVEGWEEWHDYYEDFQDILEEEYGIDLDDYKEAV